MGIGLPPVVAYGTILPVLEFDVTLSPDAPVGSTAAVTILQDGTVNGMTNFTAVSDNVGPLTFTPGMVPSNSGNPAIDGSVSVVSPIAVAPPAAVAVTTHSQSTASKLSVTVRRVAVSSSASTAVVQPETVNIFVVPSASASSALLAEEAAAAAISVVTVQPEATVVSTPLTVSPAAAGESAPTTSAAAGAVRSADPGASLSLAAQGASKITVTALAGPATVRSPTAVLDEVYRLLSAMSNTPLGSGYDITTDDRELLADSWEPGDILEDLD
jgi:hypothetical protein